MRSVEALFSGLILFVIATCIAVPSEQAAPSPINPTQWVEDLDHKVAAGVDIVVADIEFSDYCSAMRKDIESVSPYNITKTAYEGLYDLCMKHLNETVMPAFERLGSCQKHLTIGKSNPTDRFKRFDPITLGLIVVSCYSLITSAVSGTVLFQQHNKLVEISGLANTLKETANSLRDDLETARNIRAEMMKTEESNHNATEANKEAILYTAKLLPRISWEAAMLVVTLKDTHDNYDLLAKSCRENKINVDALRHLSKRREFDHLNTADTELFDVTTQDNSTITISFKHSTSSPDTSVYRSVAIDHWRDVFGKKQFMRYKGPVYMLHNATSNCSAGIWEPRFRQSYIRCDKPNYTDPNLLDWVAIKPPMEQPFELVQVGDQVIGQCFHRNVTLDGRMYVCPDYVWSVPFTTNVVLVNITRTVRSRKVKFTTNLAKLPPLAWDYDMGSYNDFLVKMNKSRSQNSASVKTLKIEKDNIHIDEMLAVGWGREIIFAIAGVMLVCLIIGLIYFCKGREVGNGRGSQAITHDRGGQAITNDRSGQTINNNIILNCPPPGSASRSGQSRYDPPPAYQAASAPAPAGIFGCRAIGWIGSAAAEEPGEDHLSVRTAASVTYSADDSLETDQGPESD